MISCKKSRFQLLFDSTGGLHLTAYVNPSDKSRPIKAQLEDTLRQAEAFLHPILSYEEQMRFLMPIERLLDNSELLAKRRGAIGLFRNQNMFRIVNFPIDISYQFSIASTFHIKPLLRWMQIDQDFLFIGLMGKESKLYLGDQRNFRLLTLSEENDDLRSYVERNLLKENLPLYFSGPEELFHLFVSRSSRFFERAMRVSLIFDEQNLEACLETIRKDLRLKATERRKAALNDYEYAKELSLAEDNIFRIARLAHERSLKKLIIAEDRKLFGKMDPVSGKLTTHPHDLDHEDDDILDDLAQKVLARGGEVVLMPYEEMMEGHLALAILDYGMTHMRRYPAERPRLTEVSAP